MFRFHLKILLFLTLVAKMIQQGENLLCYFGRGQYDEHFFEIILNLDPWLKRLALQL